MEIRTFRDYTGIKQCAKEEIDIYNERPDTSAIIFSVVLNTVYHFETRVEHKTLMNCRNIIKVGGWYYFLSVDYGNYIMKDSKRSILKIRDLNDYLVHAKNQAINMSFSDIGLSTAKNCVYSQFVMRSDYNNYNMLFEITYDHEQIDLLKIMNIHVGDVIYGNKPIRIKSAGKPL